MNTEEEKKKRQDSEIHMSVSVEKLKNILRESAAKRIAVLGDLMLDVYLWGTASRLSQEAPVPVLHVKRRDIRLGGAANVMRNLSALSDCSITAFGVAGRDEGGTYLKDLLGKSGIDPAYVVIDPERRTTEKQRVIAGSQQVVRMDFEDTWPVSGSVREQISDALKNKIRNRELDAVIFEDYAKGLLEKDMLQEIVDLASEYGVYTSLDPHPGHAMEVHSLSLMTPNRAEAFGLAGVYPFDPALKVEDDLHLKQVAQRIAETWRPESLLITLGHQGMALFERNSPDTPLVIPTIAREVFDVSGAGDTVIASFTLCMVSGASTAEAADISNHAAGIVVGKAGTATPTVQELLESFHKV